MARGSSSSGTYRGWEAQQRAEQRAREQAARLKEQQRKVRERERILAEGETRDQDAARRTSAVEQRIAELAGLLQSSLARDPRIDIASPARTPGVMVGDLAGITDIGRGTHQRSWARRGAPKISSNLNQP